MDDLEDMPKFNRDVMIILQDLGFAGGDYIEDHLLDYEQSFMMLLEQYGGDRDQAL